MLGSFVNAVAIILGGLLGLLIHSRLPSRVTEMAFYGIGLFTIYLGLSLAARGAEPLLLVLCLVAGAMVGELLHLDERLHNLGNHLGRRIKTGGDKFTEGFVTATLLFAVGSMAILGAIEEGLGGQPTIYFTKAILDGFSALALAASLGAGVILAAVPVFLYQGALTLLAGWGKDFLTDPVIRETTAMGGLILLGLGISILGIKNLRVINMLPALIFAALGAFFLG
jgi:uncharacterized membrane protein YqgA involved in biofilm formation